MEFTQDTFRYLDLARKNQMKLPWYEKNTEFYRTAVREPMSCLVVKIWDRFSSELPRIKIDPKRISRPRRSVRMLDSGEPMVKAESSFYFAETPTSRFEWNPGIFFKLSSEPDGNALKIGLYDLISSRQTRIMRQEISENFEAFHALLSEKQLKKRFGGLQGETYTRFPKLYDEREPYAQYLKFKMFYLSRTYTREEVLKKNFQAQVVKDLEVALPFLHWIRSRVKVYEREEQKMKSGPVFLERGAFDLEDW